jgi:hypothetical protein
MLPTIGSVQATINLQLQLLTVLKCVSMRKANIDFIMSVRSFIHLYHDDFRRKDFVKFQLILLKESDDILRFMKKSIKNNGYFSCIAMYIHDSWP